MDLPKGRYVGLTGSLRVPWVVSSSGVVHLAAVTPEIPPPPSAGQAR